MKRSFKLLSLFAMSGLVIQQAAALDWTVVLSEESASALNADARPYYADAVEQLDHVNYEEAVQLLSEAAERAPSHVDLQFLTATRARSLAGTYYSASSYGDPLGMTWTSPDWRTSEPYVEIAESALNRLQTITDLDTEERRRLENELEALQALAPTLGERDAARFESALPVVQLVADQRREAAGFDERADDLDPLDPATYFLLRGENTSALEIAESLTGTGSEDEEDEALLLEDPFAPLPGEFTEPFLPPPPQPNQGAPGQGFQDPFAAQGPDPFASGPAGFGPPPAAGGDPGVNPFAGGK